MASATRSKTSKKKSSTAPPYIRMVFEAIMHSHHGGKGVSRAKIANYMKANWTDIATGATFNSNLRRALQSGVKRGVLVKGASQQRYKITHLGRKESTESSSSKKYDAEEEEANKAKKAAKKKDAEKKKEEDKKAAAKKKKEAEAKKKRKKKATAGSKNKESASKKASSKKSAKVATRRSTRTRSS